jgi:hypothetical protein
MLNYNTSLTSAPPYSPAQKADALKALSAGSPYSKFGGVHDDVFRSEGAKNASTFDLEATKANTDYQLAQQAAERQLVLQGLQQMGQAQQNQQNLTNTRLQNMYGTANNLLGGLFS